MPVATDHKREDAMDQHNRRRDDAMLGVLVERIDGVCTDIGEMKSGMIQLAAAMTKLAVVEERQTQTINAQDRIVATVDRWMARQELHEKMCMAQDKELRILIADSNERLSGRVAELEKAEPMQEQTGKWVMAAVWGAAGLLVTLVSLLITKQLGLM
jgi:1-deoxy-D-xylulose 5-phosphate reductoisomerase